MFLSQSVSFNIPGKVGPPPPPPASGTLYSAALKSVLKQRIQNQDYWTFESGTNVPGSGAYFVSRKNAFMANAFNVYPGPTPYDGSWNLSDPIPDDVSAQLDPDKQYPEFVDFLSAAWWGYIMDDTAALEKCKNAWLKQISPTDNPLMQFDQPRWTPGGGQRWQRNPFFFLGALLRIYAIIFYCIRSTLSPQQEAASIDWLTRWGNFQIANLDDGFDDIFDSRADRDAGNYNSTLENLGVWTQDVTHQGGYQVPIGSMRWNNRAITTAVGIGITGYIIDNDTFKDYGVYFIQNWLRFGVMPDGTVISDMGNRGGEEGLHYVGTIMTEVFDLAETAEKYGDNRLYNFSTSDGIVSPQNWGSPTNGGTKTLKMVLEATAKYYSDSWSPKRYNQGFGDLIDGFIGSGEGAYESYYYNRYNQHTQTAALIAFNKWGEQFFEDFALFKASAGYHGLKPEHQILTFGYSRSWMGFYRSKPWGIFLEYYNL